MSSYSLFSSRLDTLSVQKCFSAYFEWSKLLSELLLPFVRRSLGFLLWCLTSKSLPLSETCRSLDIFLYHSLQTLDMVVWENPSNSFKNNQTFLFWHQQSFNSHLNRFSSFFWCLVWTSASHLFNSYALLLQYTNCTKSSKSVVHFPCLPSKKSKFMQLQ